MFKIVRTAGIAAAALGFTASPAAASPFFFLQAAPTTVAAALPSPGAAAATAAGLAINTAKLPAYYVAGQFQHAELGFTVRFLPCVVAGAIFGFWLNRRLTDTSFQRFVYIATFAIGLYLIGDGAWSLARQR